MKQKSLDTIILEEAIRAKLAEQIDARAAGAKKTQDKDIAQRIYDSKGYLWDDPEGTVAAIKQIKTVQQFQSVTAELKKLTGGRDIAAYLKSFLDASDKKTWELILSYLKTQFPGNAKETLYPIGKVYFNIMNNYTDPKSGKTGAEYVSPEYIKWWKQKALDVQSGISTSAGATITKTLQQYLQQYRHEIAMAAAIATAFIPVIGPILSAGIGLADAKMYYDEGDTYTAGLITVLSLIPGGRVVAKSLARKIITKSGVLTTAEKSVLAKLAANKTLAKDQMAKLLQTAVETGKVTDAALKTMTQFVKPVSKGVYRVIGTGINIVTPLIAYDAAWNAANPNVTESEMLAILDEEEAILARDVNAMLDRAMREHVHIGIGNILSEADSGIRSSAFTPPEESDTDADSASGGSLFYLIAGGLIVKGILGKLGIAAAGGGLGVNAILKNKLGINLLKPIASYRLLRDTRKINELLKQAQVKGFTRNVYKGIVVKARIGTRDALAKIIQDFRFGKYQSVDAAVTEFVNTAPLSEKYKSLINQDALKKKFGEIAKKSPAAQSAIDRGATTVTTPTSTSPYTSTKIGFQQSTRATKWPYPNITSDQFNKLSYNQRELLKNNPTYRLRDLM
jgi:hypothetical protein